MKAYILILRDAWQDFRAMRSLRPLSRLVNALGIAFVLLMVALLLVGCGGGGDDDYAARLRGEIAVPASAGLPTLAPAATATTAPAAYPTQAAASYPTAAPLPTTAPAVVAPVEPAPVVVQDVQPLPAAEPVQAVAPAAPAPAPVEVPPVVEPCYVDEGGQLRNADGTPCTWGQP